VLDERKRKLRERFVDRFLEFARKVGPAPVSMLATRYASVAQSADDSLLRDGQRSRVHEKIHAQPLPEATPGGN